MRFGTKRNSSAVGRVPDAGILGDEARRDWLGPGRDDRLGEAHDARPLGGLDPHGVGGGEHALAANDRHLALAGEARQAGRQALDDAVLPFADRREFDGRRAEADAVRRHAGRLVDGLGDVEERLRGNAADVEADAAEFWPAVDQHHLLPEVGGAERRGIAAGAGAENEQIGLEIGRSGRILRRSCRRRGGAACAERRCGGLSFDARVGREQAALAHLVADLDVDLADDAVLRRRDVERRLVAFEGEQRRLFADRLSGRNQDLDDRDVLEVADVGKADVLRHGPSSDCFRG